MCELLVCVREREGHNPRLIGEGHVIVVCPDGWGWSQAERSNPDWRIVRVNMSIEEARTLTARQFPIAPEMHEPAVRAFWLDPQKWPADLAAWWADDSRAEPIRDIAAELIAAAKADEPLYMRPNVIGAAPIIG